MSSKHHILFDLDGTLNMPYLAMVSLKTICIS